MKKILPFILGVLFSITGSAQMLPTVFVYNTSNDSTCDGYAYLTDSISYSDAVWYGPNVVLQNGGYSISNLCPGTYSVTVSDSMGTTTSYSFTVSSGGAGNCNGFYAVVSSETNATNSGSCDGAAIITVYGGTAPYTYTSTGLIMPNGTLVNLCVGSNIVTVTDANGCTTSAPVTIYSNSDTLNNPGIYGGLWVNPSDASASGQCDGGFTLTILDSILEASIIQVNDYYGNLVASGVGSATTSNTLCAGLYTLTSVSPNGSALWSSSFIIGDGTNVYVDSTSYFNNGNPGGNDTIYAPVVPTCTVVYALIDSTNLGSVNYLGQDSVAVEWLVYANGLASTVTSIYQFDSAGNYLLVLQIFCDSTRAVETFKSYAWAYLDPSGTIGIEPILSNDRIRLFPNPVSSQLNVDLESEKWNKLTISTLLGQELVSVRNSFNQKVVEINVESLSSGVYYLSTDSGIIRKLIKE